MTQAKKFFTAGILAVLLCSMPARSPASVAVSITIAPPVLPVYVQPPCPAEGYLWTPGYWAWGPYGYYWVPGVWVQPPEIGFLWTPGYWGFASSVYLWHPGYWGPHVGFYGGVNYGFGYMGIGFVGGFWSGHVFRYNTAVTNVNTTVIRNVYVDRNVVNRTIVAHNRVSFNGPGGVMARPAAQEQIAMRERHLQPTTTQFAHQQTASRDRAQFVSFNHGRPAVVAMDSVNGHRFNQQGRITTNNVDNRKGANVQYRNNRVDERRNEQQQRTAQGIRSREMSPGEAAKVERREQNTSRQVKADRHANGGRPTPGEKSNVNREQNRTSRQIYEDKHNEKVAPR